MATMNVTEKHEITVTVTVTANGRGDWECRQDAVKQLLQAAEGVAEDSEGRSSIEELVREVFPWCFEKVEASEPSELSLQEARLDAVKMMLRGLNARGEITGSVERDCKITMWHLARVIVAAVPGLTVEGAEKLIAEAGDPASSGVWDAGPSKTSW